LGSTGVFLSNSYQLPFEFSPMKYFHRIIFSIAALVFSQAHAQESSKPAPTPVQLEPALVKFDLNFPGGTPNELVAAIQKATGRPLNAIVNPEDANSQLPPLKMSGVTVPALFEALREASVRHKFVGEFYNQVRLGFEAHGKASDDAVWFFRVDVDPPPPKGSRFYLLAPYLEQGLTVDDITTAVQTAWKLRGDTPQALLNYHKETKLLIAVGYPSELSTIDAVLQALGQPKSKTELEKESKTTATDQKTKS
jgi:hypothetical protein